MAGGNKEKVVQAAMELFHRKGFQATGLEEILTQSGVCKSNFYYHFKSKDELGLSVLEVKMKEMRQDYIEPTLGQKDRPPRDRLIRFFTAMILYSESNGCREGCMFGNLTLEMADRHEGMRTRLEAYFRELERKIAELLREGLADGSIGLKGLSPEEAATAAVALLQGGILLAKGYRDAAPLTSGLNLLLHFIGAHGEAAGE